MRLKPGGWMFCGDVTSGRMAVGSSTPKNTTLD